MDSAHVLSLAQARQRAVEAAQLRQQGLDPKLVWAAENQPVAASFGDLALEYIGDRKAG